MKDVVDLDAAIAAAVEAIRGKYGDGLINALAFEDVARTAVEAAAEVLGLVNLRSITGAREQSVGVQAVVHALYPRDGSTAACGADWPFLRQPDTSGGYAHTTCPVCAKVLTSIGITLANPLQMLTIEPKGDVL
jgi:hypothetical protein